MKKNRKNIFEDRKKTKNYLFSANKCCSKDDKFKHKIELHFFFHNLKKLSTLIHIFTNAWVQINFLKMEKINLKKNDLTQKCLDLLNKFVSKDDSVT